MSEIRPIGSPNPLEDALAIPQTGITIAASTATTAQAYPARAQLMRVQTNVQIFLSLDSTGAHIPTATIAATTASSGKQAIVNPGDDPLFIVSGKTTSDKFSVAGSTAGIAVFHFYGTG